MTNVLQRNAVLAFLRDHPLATIATQSKGGRPDLATVYCLVQDDFSCRFVTKVDTRKFANIDARPDAAILFCDEEELATVEIGGVITPLSDTVEIARGIEQFQDMISAQKGTYWIPPIAQVQAGHYAVCALTPDIVRYSAFAVDPQDTTLPQQLSFTP